MAQPTLTVAGAQREVRVRLTGHLDPLDGRYHWQGTVFDPLIGDMLKNSRVATVESERARPHHRANPVGDALGRRAGTPPYAGSGR